MRRSRHELWSLQAFSHHSRPSRSTLLKLFSVCPQVAHMTKSEMHLHDLVFLGPGLLFLDQYFNSFIDEYLVLWIALVSS